jgi:hypothetical protein
MESNPRKYLGEETFTSYSKSIHDEIFMVLETHNMNHHQNNEDEDEVCTDGKKHNIL